MGVPADEPHPGETPVKESFSEAERQWEILKGNVPGYAEFKAQKDADAEARWYREETKQGCEQLHKFFELTADETNEDSSATDTLTPCLKECIKDLENILKLEVRGDEAEARDHGSLSCLYAESEDEEGILGTVEKVTIRPAMDSGSVDNVIHPRELPDDAEPRPNTSGKHFRGANNSVIEKFGSCDTILESPLGTVGCGWQLADVTRPLHSVSKVTGPAGVPGKQDVLFNNEICVVMPPGVVNEILKRYKPIAEYKREGNLYVGEMTMSSFRRQGQKA